MAQPPEIDVEEYAHGEGEPHAPRGAHVNWAPMLVLLGLLVVWLALTPLVNDRLPGMRDAARAIAYALGLALLCTGIPALAKRFGPAKMASGTRTALAVLACFVLAIPLVIGLYWSTYDALVPVEIRAAGKLPEVGSLIDRNEHDVVRILGNNTVVAQEELFADDAGASTRPGGADAARLVVYSLPDLSELASRPAKRASLQAEAQLPEVELGQGIDPSSWNSDAIVAVTYGSDSSALAVRSDISVKAVRRALSALTSQTVLAASGIQADVSASSVDTVSASSASGGAGLGVLQGVGQTVGTRVGYQLELGGLANFLTSRGRIEPGKGADLGDVTLVVAPSMAPPPTSAAASTVVTYTQVAPVIANSSSDDPVRLGNQDYADRDMWVILASRAYGDEADAQKRARELNGRRKPIRFSVERSGHLTGLSNTDYFVVIWDIGYVYEDDANKAVVTNAGILPMTDVSVVHVHKCCGDFSLAKLVE